MPPSSRFTILPYGEFNRAERANVGAAVPPPRFRAPNQAIPRPKQWNRLFDLILAEINEVLWPCWDPAAKSWARSPAVARMRDLTLADHHLLDHLQNLESGRGLDASIASPGRKLNAYTHREMFLIEDDRPRRDDLPKEGFASFYHQYDRQLDQEAADLVSELFFRFLDACLLTTSHRVKDRLQRPRPYQTALPLGFSGYRYEPGDTANTPSACSGHCLQGLTGVAAAAEFLRSEHPGFGDANSVCLQQFAVDIGDRRVFAGIHYPSDNLCSWLMLLRLAPFLFTSRGMRKWIWQAIEKRSRVYCEIARFAQSAQGAVYSPILSRLKQAAEAAPLKLT